MFMEKEKQFWHNCVSDPSAAQILDESLKVMVFTVGAIGSIRGRKIQQFISSYFVYSVPHSFLSEANI